MRMHQRRFPFELRAHQSFFVCLSTMTLDESCWYFHEGECERCVPQGCNPTRVRSKLLRHDGHFRVQRLLETPSAQESSPSDTPPTASQHDAMPLSSRSTRLALAFLCSCGAVWCCNSPRPLRRLAVRDVIHSRHGVILGSARGPRVVHLVVVWDAA